MKIAVGRVVFFGGGLRLGWTHASTASSTPPCRMCFVSFCRGAGLG